MNEKRKVRSLALDDLDIEELERRLELAQAVAPSEWGCNKCGVDCQTACQEYLICQADIFR